MKNAVIKITGISERAIVYIMAFFAVEGISLDSNSESMPFIGLIRASKVWLDGGETVEKGEQFIVGAIRRDNIVDEIIFRADLFDIAVRIPRYDRFCGSYYFDIQDNEIVNIS